jgi:hypothetical protein
MSEILAGAQSKREDVSGDTESQQQDAQSEEQSQTQGENAGGGRESGDVTEGESVADAAAGEDQKASAQSKNGEHDDDDAEEKEVPEDLSGLKKALVAARSDKKKERKARREFEAKTRETENKLAELRGRVAAFEQYQQSISSKHQVDAQQQPKQDQPEPDLDFDSFLSNGPEAVKAYVQHQIKRGVDTALERTSEIDRAAMGRMLTLSEQIARMRHNDFDQYTSKYTPDKQALDAIVASKDPGETYYQYAKASVQFSGVNSIDELRSVIEADVRKKLESELLAKQSQKPTPQQKQRQPEIPKSTASARGNGIGAPSGWSGPVPFEQILGR